MAETEVRQIPQKLFKSVDQLLIKLLKTNVTKRSTAKNHYHKKMDHWQRQQQQKDAIKKQQIKNEQIVNILRIIQISASVLFIILIVLFKINQVTWAFLLDIINYG